MDEQIYESFQDIKYHFTTAESALLNDDLAELVQVLTSVKDVVEETLTDLRYLVPAE